MCINEEVNIDRNLPNHCTHDSVRRLRDAELDPGGAGGVGTTPGLVWRPVFIAVGRFIEDDLAAVDELASPRGATSSAHSEPSAGLVIWGPLVKYHFCVADPLQSKLSTSWRPRQMLRPGHRHTWSCHRWDGSCIGAAAATETRARAKRAMSCILERGIERWVDIGTLLIFMLEFERPWLAAAKPATATWDSVKSEIKHSRAPDNSFGG
ncbi:hypothetical protein DFH08DRAFT_822478 [Mycena albidolilacea]|uniref:Uncharacterized protein n=1 Tax=Mycena albidolilacea TaxID=1033008 RepID=A0AAD6Z923_9AGAR|nr:hypothetical protein DFH08DRAFT_822478 [Mycena albidolilacea]